MSVLNQVVAELSTLISLKREEMVTRKKQLHIVTGEIERIHPTYRSLPQGPPSK